MPNQIFSVELLTAVSDWQRGGDARQKAKRGVALKVAAEKLPAGYRQAHLVCFRQVALDGACLRRLGNDLGLVETISAWTLQTEVAKDFKGGVPPAGQGLQGVIFEHVPQPGEVVVNLQALYSDPEFQEAYERSASKIDGFYEGMGRWQGSQSEVVLEVDTLPLRAAHAVGGHSSSKQYFMRMILGPAPTDAEQQIFEQWVSLAGAKFGPKWIAGEAKDRTMAKFLESL